MVVIAVFVDWLRATGYQRPLRKVSQLGALPPSVTKAEPNSIRVHLAYADWLLQQNEVEQAKIHAEAAAKIKADDPEVLKIEGLIARVQKDLAAAEKLFRMLDAEEAADGRS